MNREDFPMFKNNPEMVYLDSAATSFKPTCVLDKLNEYYTHYGVNIHRGVYELGYKATNEYEKARYTVAKFLNATYDEIIFTRGVTDSLNMICQMLKDRLDNKSNVVTSELEHHSSLLPWMQACHEQGSTLRYIPLTQEGKITVSNALSVIDKNTKIVAITYVSNVMGYITPLKEIIEAAHKVGALVIVDAAQAAPHMAIDVKELDCDFLGFAGHKICGPTGIGVLYGKKALLETLTPCDFGGDMIDEVYKDHCTLKELPYRFESGTVMISEILGLAKACEYLMNLGFDKINAYDQTLRSQLIEGLKHIDGVELYNPNTDLALASFNIKGVHPHDAATFYDQDHICIRAGHHCAELVSRFLGVSGTLRASVYFYNTPEDIDKFLKATQGVVDFFKELGGGF